MESLPEDLSSQGRDVFETVLMKCVCRAFSRLPSDEAELVWQHVVEGVNLKEIALQRRRQYKAVLVMYARICSDLRKAS
jgi:hypothetical protein